MLYRAIGLMSGSSLDGLDIAFAEFSAQGGKWEYELLHTDCYAYTAEWKERLENAQHLTAKDYLLLHTEYGHYLGQQVNHFIESNNLQYKVALVASHGHTVFHVPAKKMTAQVGDGAAIAAVTGLPVVSDLRALDVALGGQGAPIVPVGERMLFNGYDLFLNLGGIANISVNNDPYIAFDVCPANRVLNMLALDAGKEYDENGDLAASGKLSVELLEKLNALPYYQQPAPKSLANDFGTDTVYPMIRNSGCTIADGLHTYAEHIAFQVSKAVPAIHQKDGSSAERRLLVTGGGAFNKFLVGKLTDKLKEQQVELIAPGPGLINYKEALVMAFIGVLRWRQEYNVLSSATGASRNSIGGALWTGQDA